MAYTGTPTHLHFFRHSVRDGVAQLRQGIHVCWGLVLRRSLGAVSGGQPNTRNVELRAKREWVRAMCESLPVRKKIALLPCRQWL